MTVLLLSRRISFVYFLVLLGRVQDEVLVYIGTTAADWERLLKMSFKQSKSVLMLMEFILMAFPRTEIVSTMFYDKLEFRFQGIICTIVV